MNIREIDKWLDNEYGVSYTRLEELHDFVVEQDMKHQEEAEKEIERLNFDKEQLNSLVNSCQKEIRRLKEELKQAKEMTLNEHKYASEMEDKYIEVNNIINEIYTFLSQYTITHTWQKVVIEDTIKYIDELKGSE